MSSKGDCGASEFDRVRDYFTRSAEQFDSLYAEGRMNPLMRFLNRTFRRDIYERFLLSLEHVRAYHLSTALDVGCGSGRYLAALAELGMARIVGIDCSPTMVELARGNLGSSNGSGQNVELVCADFVDFSTDEVFDVVVAMGVFDYVKEPAPFLKKMNTLARHSVIASFPSVSVYRTPIRKARYVFKRCPVYFYDRRGIAALGSQAGFPKTEIRKIKGSGQDYFVTLFR